MADLGLGVLGIRIPSYHSRFYMRVAYFLNPKPPSIPTPKTPSSKPKPTPNSLITCYITPLNPLSINLLIFPTPQLPTSHRSYTPPKKARRDLNHFRGPSVMRIAPSAMGALTDEGSARCKRYLGAGKPCKRGRGWCGILLLETYGDYNGGKRVRHLAFRSIWGL